MGCHLPDAWPSLLKLPIMFSFAMTDIGLCSQKELLVRMTKKKKRASASLCVALQDVTITSYLRRR